MKTPISKSVLAVVLAGMALIAGLVELRLHSGKPSAVEAASAVTEKTAATAAAAPAPKAAPAKPAANVGTLNNSLPVIPISLTPFLDAVDAAVARTDSAMQSLPHGPQVYGGIDFLLEGAINLQGLGTLEEQNKSYRTNAVVSLDETNTVEGKSVVTERGKGIVCLYLLAGGRFASEKPGEKTADVVWHYADGTALRSALQNNVHVRDWWRRPYEQPAQLPSPNTKVAWHSTQPGSNGRTLRLYRIAVVNPHPEKTVRAIGFASAMNRPSLFVAALTLDPLMPGARPDDLTSEEVADPEMNGQLQLYVQDADGHPLADVEVNSHFQAGKLDAPGQKYVTDNSGLARVRFPDTGLESLDVSAAHDGFSGRKMLWDVKAGDVVPASYTLKLSAEVKIGGVVVDEQEVPIPGVSIRLYRFWSSQDDRPNKKGEQASFSTMSTSTDDTGRWEAKGLPATLLDHISVEAKHPEYIGEQSTVGGTAEKALRAETYKMILKRGLEVTGQVLDESGNPISGATVFAGQRYYRERQQMNTGDDGRFHFKRMAEGAMEFSVTAKGRMPAVKSVTVKPDMGEIIFRLGLGKTIRALVRNAAGDPLPGTRVSLESANGGVAESYEFETTTGDDGRFTWDGAPDEPVHFYFYKSGYEQKRRQLLQPDIENIITLQKTRTVHGQVVDADTGNPVTKFRIGFGRNPGGGNFYADYPGMADHADANGMFSLDLNEEEDTQVKAEADDYAEQIQPLPAAQNDTVQVTLRLKPSPALHGVVVSPAGQPLPGVSVTMTTSGGGSSASLAGGKLRAYGSGPKISITDDEGKFILPSPPQGATVVAVGEAGFANVPVEQVRQNSTIVLQPFGRIEGTLKIGGQPGAGKDVMLTLSIPGIGTDWDSYKRTTDDQGHFTIEHVPPGEVQLVRLIATGVNSWGHSDNTVVTVNPGETTQVTLGDKGAVLAGRIRCEVQPANDAGANFDGRLSHPLPPRPAFHSPDEAKAYYNSPEWKALMKQQKNYVAEIHPDGSFEVDDVVPGTYSMTVDARVGGQRPWEHQPFAQGSTTITVPDSFDPASPMDVGEIVLQPVQSH
ncbi:MAG: carboxypeptidase regulatory-like domain-containing protein [Verrucomicrobiae bacterium]|nr:carboxypeptidase regulatory-like domain-containing protein [Verrucomicrobiae bacterium]